MTEPMLTLSRDSGKQNIGIDRFVPLETMKLQRNAMRQAMDRSAGTKYFGR